MTYFLIAIIFFIAELLYFRIANHYNIIDHPNERSSHTKITIRGGGIIFIISAICCVVLQPNYWLPMLGVLIIGLISFLDDMFTLSSKIRLLFHIAAATIIFFYLNTFHLAAFYISFLLYIMVIGVINMYNFMDGINGITGAYSLVVLGGLQYLNIYQVSFVHTDVIWLPILATIVLLFFNFRTKAKCFAGDVGSVTIAFWIILLLLKLIFITHNWVYILFLVVYGIDSVMTIAHRLILKQNIFKPHRLHFYQLLVNEKGWSHLWVSFLYALMQGVIILAIIEWQGINSTLFFIVIIIPLMTVFLLFKPTLIGKTDKK